MSAEIQMGDNGEVVPSEEAQDKFEYYMRMALREAEAALDEREVPIGAVIVLDGKVIGKAHNQREQLLDPTAHAEIIAITQAAAELQNWRLSGSTMFVTVEPCSMCAGALVLARIKTLVYGADNPDAGAAGTLFNIPQHPKLNHRVEIHPGVLAEECGQMMKEFFALRRQKAARDEQASRM